VIENTAFVADFVLYFPKFFEKILKQKVDWKTIIEPAIDLTLRSSLIDEETSKAINLVRL
jgi:hypothetical protein